MTWSMRKWWTRKTRRRNETCHVCLTLCLFRIECSTMQIPHPDRRAEIDKRVVRLAPQLTPSSIATFGTVGVRGIPARMRKRIIGTVTGPLPFDEAGRAMKVGDYQRAKTYYLQCLEQANGNLSDGRYFGVYWSLGRIALIEGDKRGAEDRYRQAIVTYPTSCRETHYCTLAELLLEQGRETEAAAIVQQGMTHLGITAEKASAGRPGGKLLALQPTLEMKHTGETRPSFPAAYLM